MRQLENTLFFALTLGLMIAATQLGGCAKGDVVPYAETTSPGSSRL